MRRHPARSAPPAHRATRLRQEGVRVTKVGVTNLGASNRAEGCWSLRTPSKAPPAKAPDRGKLGWPGLERGRATQRRSSRGQPRRHPGQPGKSEAGLGRSRSCSWFVEIAGIGFRCPSTFRESERSRKRVRGLDTEARRSGRSTTLSFDEAAAQAGLVLFQRRARQRASAAGTRPSPWPKTPAGGSAARRALDRELTGPSGAGSKGNRGASRARPKRGARRQARSSPRSRRWSGASPAGGSGSQPPR